MKKRERRNLNSFFKVVGRTLLLFILHHTLEFHYRISPRPLSLTSNSLTRNARTRLSTKERGPSSLPLSLSLQMGKRHDPASIRASKRPSSTLSVISKGRAKTRSDKPKVSHHQKRHTLLTQTLPPSLHAC